MFALGLLFLFQKKWSDEFYTVFKHEILKENLGKLFLVMVKHCICMVSDFFYPNMGGVESHIFQVKIFDQPRFFA